MNWQRSRPPPRRNGSPCRRVPTSPSRSRSFGRVVAALGSGRHADAYNFAERLFDPADSAYHPVISSWLIGDLAEAALDLDRVEEARVRVEQVEAQAGESPGSWIALGLNHARALLAERPRGGGAVSGGARCRFRPLAVPARPRSACFRSVAEAAEADHRFAGSVTRRARRLRRAWLPNVGRPGPPRGARGWRVKPASRA